MTGGYQIIDFNNQVNFGQSVLGVKQPCVGVYEQVQVNRLKPMMFTNFATAYHTGYAVCEGSLTVDGVSGYTFILGQFNIKVWADDTCTVSKLIQ